MKSFKNPVFLFGIVATIVIIVGMLISSPEYKTNNNVFYVGVGMLGLFWFCSMIQVAITNELQGYQKMFWLIIVISVPVLGGFVYQVMHQQKNKIVT